MKDRETITAAELDEAFDNGEEVLHYFDLSTARRQGREAKGVNVDFPAWMMRALDGEARRLGITRQALIKTWIADRLDAREGGPAER